MRISDLEFDILIDLWPSSEPLYVLIREDDIAASLEALVRLMDLGLVAWSQGDPDDWKKGVRLSLSKLEEYVEGRRRAGETLKGYSLAVDEYEFDLTLKGCEVYCAEVRARGEDVYTELPELAKVECGILRLCAAGPVGLLAVLSHFVNEARPKVFFGFFPVSEKRAVRAVTDALGRLLRYYFLTVAKRGDDTPRRAYEVPYELEKYVALRQSEGLDLSDVSHDQEDYTFRLTEEGLRFLERRESPNMR